MEAMQKIKCLTIEDSNFPDRLRKLSGMPKKLYYIGNLPDPKKPAAAVVGARMCSPYGRCQAFKYARTMASYGVQIISGMARGIDAEGHKGALDTDTPTFAVLGSGVDVCYPNSNRWLYQRILEKGGGIISELPGLSACELGVPGKKPDHQRTFRCCSCGRSQGTEWFFDHCKLCPGTWTQCLCPSGSCDRGTEQRLQQTDLRWCRNRLQPGNHAYGMGNRGKKQTSKCGKKEVGACTGFGFGV